MIANESARFKALRAHHILDTDPEQVFDDLTLLASQVCGTPIAPITLVDEHRQWFKSKASTVLRNWADCCPTARPVRSTSPFPPIRQRWSQSAMG